MSKGSSRGVKWIDGLRGLASFSVVITHLSRAFDYSLFFPSDDEKTTPRIWQWPFIRIIWQGRIGVTIFALLTGYVCALKPLRLVRAKDHHGALTAVAKSAFRRLPRLVLPAALAMIVAWVACQCGAFTVAHRVDASWIRDASPVPDATIDKAFARLIQNFRWVWTIGRMDYDDHQWALLPLMKGSMMVFITICATTYVKDDYRLLIYLVMYGYFYLDAEPDTETFGAQFCFGILLCDLFSDTRVQDYTTGNPRTRKVLSSFLLVVGLFFASYPSDHSEWCTWSEWMALASPSLFPENVNIPKRFTALGVEFIVLGIHLSTTAKAWLAHPALLWLGKHSFAVYLIHGTLLRTVLVWMIYGISGEPWVKITNAQGEVIEPPWLPRAGFLTFTIAIPAWLLVVYGVAHLWTAYVDTLCARITLWLERITFEDEEKVNRNGTSIA